MRLLAIVGLLALGGACGDVAPLGAAAQVATSLPAHPLDVVGEAAAGQDLPATFALGPPYPIIMVHGFSGWDGIGPLDYFFQVRSALEDEGDDVTTPALPPYTSSDERARVLATVIDDVLKRTQKAKVHLIGHSQGGMDILRVVGAGIDGVRYGDKVASVTMVSTPFQGSAVADVASSAPDGVLNPAGQFLAWLLGAGGQPPSSWATSDTSDAWTPDIAAAIRGLTPAESAILTSHNRVPSGVPFFTVAGVSNLRSLDVPQCNASLWGKPDGVDDVDPLLFASGTYLSFTEGGDVGAPMPNDGLVTVTSARHPQSTFLGCVPADHFDEIGQIADVIPDIISGFDHVELYRRLVANARSVE